MVSCLSYIFLITVRGLIGILRIFQICSDDGLDLELRKKLAKCYIWSIALYGAETWTLRAADRKYLEVLKCGAGEGRRRIIGPSM
jgi:hypothetical protein